MINLFCKILGDWTAGTAYAWKKVRLDRKWSWALPSGESILFQSRDRSGRLETTTMGNGGEITGHLRKLIKKNGTVVKEENRATVKNTHLAAPGFPVQTVPKSPITPWLKPHPRHQGDSTCSSSSGRKDPLGYGREETSLLSFVSCVFIDWLWYDL